MLIWVVAFLWAFRGIANDIHDAVEFNEEEYDRKSKEQETEEEIP